MRTVDVAAERIAGWLERFAARHGALTWVNNGTVVVVTAADRAVASCEVPFPPLSGSDGPYAGLVEHSLRDRRVGVLLVRLGGYAAGVFEGNRLVASKVGSRHVQGRSAAGGWSQQRFARRRAGQAKVAYAAAAEVAASILLPAADTLDAVVLGGDRRAVDDVMADRRLEPLRPLVVERRVDVPDPRRAVLESTPGMYRAIRIRLADQPLVPEPSGRPELRS